MFLKKLKFLKLEKLIFLDKCLCVPIGRNLLKRVVHLYIPNLEDILIIRDL